MNNFSSYLEYPDEVLYKIPDLENKLISSSEIVKNQINYMVSRKIRRINEENHYFIEKTQDFFSKLILSNIKTKPIFDYYKEYRIKENLFIILQYNNYKSEITEEYLTENEYVNKIKNIIKEYKIIITKIENIINDDWIFQKCSEDNITENNDYLQIINDSDLISSDNLNKTKIICYDYKNKSSLNYSEYNFNVVKIRTGIYYIKYLYEKLENLFNQLNFDTLMNLTLIKQKDELINDKNIINLYEQSLEKTKEFNKESEDILEEYFQYYEEDINDTIINKLDFTENFDRFTKVLNFTEENFKFEVDKQYKKATENFLVKLDNYKQILDEQLNLSTNYEKFNFNYNNFNAETEKSLTIIKQEFNNLKDKVKNISNNYLFNNILKTRIETLNMEKTKYITNIVEELSKNYEIRPFNLSLNISERTEKIAMKILNNLMINFIYDYIELYEGNRDTYINSILKIIENKEKEIINKYNKIINEFYKKYKEYSTEYINEEYLRNYKDKYTRCLTYQNYSLEELNKTLIKDEENYARYVLYLNKLETCTKFKINDFSLSEVDIIKLNITNSSIIKILEKISDEDYINYINYINKSTGYNSTGINEEIIQEMNILNDYLSNLCEETFNQEIKFIKETAIILDCDNNLYYTNYLNMTFFNNFNEEISHNLSEISDKYKDIINSFYVGTEFIEDYIISSNYIKLENYENFPTKYLITNIENFNDMSEYIQYDCEIKYNNYMKQTLIEIFNNSFTEFMKNAISGDIEDNFLFYVFRKIEINIKYIIEKVQNEIDSYTLLLNKTKELGITSKKALISLYDYIGDRVNKSLQYQIEDYIGDNIIFFYRENKFLFRDNFINYYLQNLNKMFNVDNIFNLRSILHEFIVSRDFNKSLDNISKDLWNIWLIDNLNNKIQKILDSTISNLTAILKQQQNIIIRELENVETAELYESMLLLAEMIDNYTALVNEQNNRFKFIVSNSPMEKFSNFSSNYLEPPLSEIKEYYDMIQNELLKKINEIVSEMRDFYAEIQTKYNITEQIDEMFNVLQDTYNTLVNYSQILIDDINNYDDILVLYTFIGSSSNDMRRLNNYLRSNEKNIKKIRNIFNFTNNNSKNKRTQKISENDKINKNLRINNQINSMANSGIRKLNSFKRLSHNKQKNYNSFKKTSSNQKFSHSKKKRKLSTHSAQGSVSEATLNKESQKLMKTLKNFNKTYLSSDFLKINSNLLKEETNINKYILNSGRTIDLSVMKLASIITEDKQDELKEILYYKHKQISSHVYKFMNLTCNQTYLYQYLLRNSSEMLEYTHNEIDYIILTDFKIIKELIVGQIKEYEGDTRSENIDINERLFDLFQNDDLYKPVGFNDFNYTNNTNNIINFTLSSTINKYHKLFKMSKSRLLNFTDQKYKEISDNVEEAKKYIINKRRMSEDKQENEKNNNKEDEFEEEQEIGLDILKGELSFQYSFKI